LDVGQRIRQFHILSAYARVGEVTLLFTYENEAELDGMRALEPHCAGFHPVPVDWRGKSQRPGPSHWRRELRDSGTVRPFQAGLFFSPEMRKAAEQIAPGCSLIHVSRFCMAPHVESLLRTRPADQRFVLDLDDIETVARRRWLRISPPVQWQAKIAEYFDLVLLWRYQRKALRLFNRVFVCSEPDRDRLGSRNVAVVPNGTDVEKEMLLDDSDGRTVLCLGTYGYEPNVDGLCFFLSEILPLIRQRIPDVRLLIVGRDMPPRISALHDGKKLIVSANVPSVEPHYREATISVVPLRAGGGTRLKILEAFALGRPVVSTSIGCEGLDIIGGEHLFIADKPAAFAESCVTLLLNPGLRKQLTLNARQVAEQKYSWDAIERRIGELAGELLGGHSTPTAV